MGHDDYQLDRLTQPEETDKKLEKIAYGFFGSLVRKVGRGVKKRILLFDWKKV